MTVTEVPTALATVLGANDVMLPAVPISAKTKEPTITLLSVSTKDKNTSSPIS